MTILVTFGHILGNFGYFFTFAVFEINEVELREQLSVQLKK